VLDVAAGPDAAIRAALLQAEHDGLRLSLPGSPAELTSRRSHYDRITTHLSDDGRSAYAFATLDFEGTVGAVEVSSLGLERIAFERDGSGWKVVGNLAPNLTAIVAAMQERRLALKASESGYQPDAWYIRVERNGAVVTEDYRLLRQRVAGVDEERGTRRLTLERSGSQFVFSGSLL
jgi:hypothetical protein